MWMPSKCAWWEVMVVCESSWRLLFVVWDSIYVDFKFSSFGEFLVERTSQRVSEGLRGSERVLFVVWDSIYVDFKFSWELRFRSQNSPNKENLKSNWDLKHLNKQRKFERRFQSISNIKQRVSQSPEFSTKDGERKDRKNPQTCPQEDGEGWGTWSPEHLQDQR